MGRGLLTHVVVGGLLRALRVSLHMESAATSDADSHCRGSIMVEGACVKLPLKRGRCTQSDCLVVIWSPDVSLCPGRAYLLDVDLKMLSHDVCCFCPGRWQVRPWRPGWSRDNPPEMNPL